MRPHRLLIAAALVFMTTTARAAPSAAELDFSTRLYEELVKTTPGNLFFSPASIRLCLGLAYAGARGETAAQMKSTLGFADPKAEGAKVAAQLARWDKLAHPDPPPGAAGGDASMQRYWEGELKRRTTELHIADRLWTQTGHPFRADYLGMLKRDYRAEAVSADFKNAAEAVRVSINEWVSAQTQKKIPSLIPPHLLSPATRAVLVNAIYFKAQWAQPFTEGATQPGPFFLAAKRTTSIPLMHETADFGYAVVDGATLVELPYGDDQLSMVLVVPTAKDGLAAVEKHLGAHLGEWLTHLSVKMVDLTMPRFKMGASFALADALKQLGMPLPFTFPGADFSGIDDTKLLYISQVVHQAVVTVDEKGTEAAAATAALMAAGGMPQQPVIVRADRPFAFLIRDRGTGAVLFMGRLADPAH